MGDYVKLIVHAEVTCTKEEVETAIKEILRPTESAYHCDDAIPQLDRGVFTLAVQTKYGRGQDEFLKWLKHFVVQGSGPSSVYAMQFSEYSVDPTFHRLRNLTDEDLR